MARLSPGSDFAGDFKILRPIGSGGMGAVYEALQLSTHKHRALKILSTHIGDDPRAHQRFVREATVASQIRSAHVVEVIAAGIEPGSGLPWLAMELLDGLDLRRVVGSHGRLCPGHALAVFSQLGHGLGAAHRAGVIHRDLKPENVFVARSHRADSDFIIKVLDFGIAKLTTESVASTDTAAVGSPMWMAPEQVNAEPLSSRSDVWSLGLLAFWALTGRVYWRAAHAERVTVQALFAEQLFAPIQSATVRASEYGCAHLIPPDFDAWFAGCVARSSDERFADGTAAIRALCSIIRPLADGQPEPGPLLPPPGAEPAPGELTPLQLPRHETWGSIDGTTGQGGSDRNLETIAATDVSVSERALPAHVATAPSGRLAGTGTVEPTPARVAPLPRDNHERGSRARWALAAAIPAAAIAAGVTAVALTWPWSEEAPADDATEQVDDPPPVAAETPETQAPEALQPEALQADPPPVTPNIDTLGPANWEFLGWTVDGSAFALSRTLHEAAEPTKPLLQLVEVYDGLTGARTDLYRLDAHDATFPAKVAEELQQAQDEAAWLVRRTELLLRQPDPQRKTSHGEVAVHTDDVPLGSKVRLVPKTSSWELHWFGISALGSGLRPSPPGPLLELAYGDDDDRWVVGQMRVGPTYDDVAALTPSDGDAPSVRTTVLPYWSPAGDRTVLLVHSEVDGGSEARVDEAWMLRANGPQVRIIDAGAGADAVRAAAVTLAGIDVPVALFGTTGGRSGAGKVLYRTDAPEDRETAGRIANALELPEPMEGEPGGLICCTVLLR